MGEDIVENGGRKRVHREYVCGFKYLRTQVYEANLDIVFQEPGEKPLQMWDCLRMVVGGTAEQGMRVSSLSPGGPPSINDI